MSRFTDIINGYRAPMTRGDQHESMVDLAETVNSYADDFRALWEAAEQVNGADSFPDMSLEDLHAATEALRPLFGGEV